MAPEIFLKSNYTNKVDIWALGVLIFYMLFGEFPFKSTFLLI
jgi:serine/threonine protein kinase